MVPKSKKTLKTSLESSKHLKNTPGYSVNFQEQNTKIWFFDFSYVVLCIFHYSDLRLTSEWSWPIFEAEIKFSVIFASYPVTTYGLYIRLVYAHNVSMRQEILQNSRFWFFMMLWLSIPPTLGLKTDQFPVLGLFSRLHAFKTERKI